MPRKRPVVAQLEHFYTTARGESDRLEERIVHVGFSGEALRQALASEIETRRVALEHIAFCLRLCDPSWKPVAGVRRRKKSSPLANRDLLSRAYDVLRDADRPLTSAEIMERSAHRPQGLSAAAARTPELRSALTTLLRAEERRGAVTSHGKRPLRWKIRLSAGELAARARDVASALDQASSTAANTLASGY